MEGDRWEDRISQLMREAESFPDPFPEDRERHFEDEGGRVGL